MSHVASSRAPPSDSPTPTRATALYASRRACRADASTLVMAHTRCAGRRSLRAHAKFGSRWMGSMCLAPLHRCASSPMCSSARSGPVTQPSLGASPRCPSRTLSWESPPTGRSRSRRASAAGDGPGGGVHGRRHQASGHSARALHAAASPTSSDPSPGRQRPRGGACRGATCSVPGQCPGQCCERWFARPGCDEEADGHEEGAQHQRNEQKDDDVRKGSAASTRQVEERE
jgi:hypothetical protein